MQQLFEKFSNIFKKRRVRRPISGNCAENLAPEPQFDERKIIKERSLMGALPPKCAPLELPPQGRK